MPKKVCVRATSAPYPWIVSARPQLYGIAWGSSRSLLPCFPSEQGPQRAKLTRRSLAVTFGMLEREATIGNDSPDR